LLRREVGKEIEFVTIMLFDSLDSIREFATKYSIHRFTATRTLSLADIEIRGVVSAIRSVTTV
jgi:DNA-binding transcriptional regulator YhcF (GntR family)